MYQKEVTKETGQSFAKCADLEQFLRRMNEHEWAMLRYHMDRHATRKLHVPLGGSLLSMLIAAHAGTEPVACVSACRVMSHNDGGAIPPCLVNSSP